MQVRVNSVDDQYLLPKTMKKRLFSTTSTSHAQTGSVKMYNHNNNRLLHSCFFLPLLILLIIGKCVILNADCANKLN